MNWIEGNKPTIPDGAMGRFIVARKRKDGKIFTFPLTYCNRHRMPLADECWEAPDCAEEISDTDDEYFWTGWFSESCEHCDTFWSYQNSEDIIAFMPFPKYSA